MFGWASLFPWELVDPVPEEEVEPPPPSVLVNPLEPPVDPLKNDVLRDATLPWPVSETNVADPSVGALACALPIPSIVTR
jgi:hypothetical protein